MDRQCCPHPHKEHGKCPNKEKGKSSCKPQSPGAKDDDPDTAAGAVIQLAAGFLPHEYVNHFIKGNTVEEEEVRYEELMWQNCIEALKKIGSFKRALAVCEISERWMPVEAAITLSLIIAELSKPPFTKFVCSLTAIPQLHELAQPTVKEKVDFMQRLDWGKNTVQGNEMDVFKLILDEAVKFQLPANEMLNKVFVFSGKEYDEVFGVKYKEKYPLIKSDFEKAGYNLPDMVFWNLRGNSSKPVTKNDVNVTLFSGFSSQMLRTFLETNGEMTLSSH